MTLSRRAFVKAGALTTAGLAASSCQWFAGRTARRSFKVEIKGLCLVERKQGKITSYFVDPMKFDRTKVMTAQHYPYLSVVNADLISSTVTPEPDLYRGANFRLIPVKDQNVTVDAGLTGGPNMTFDDGPVGAAMPGSAAGWKSVKFAARMPELCGATKISDFSKFSGNVVLDHGHLEAMLPESDIGRSFIWTFTPGAGAARPRVTQALSDLLVCAMTTHNSSVTLSFGANNVVLKLPTIVRVQNLPAANAAGVCHSGVVPCVEHMALYYEVVDKQDVPTETHTGVIPLGSSADPDYCPPGSI